MRIAVVTVLFFLSVNSIFGQDNDIDYYINNSKQDQTMPETVAETDLFYIPVTGRADIFERMSEFNFSPVRYNRRGGLPHARYYWGNIELGSLNSGRPDYGLTGNLRRAGIYNHTVSGTGSSDSNTGLANGIYEYDIFGPDSHGTSVSLSASDRRGRAGARFSAAGSLGGKTDYILWVSGRWGRDSHVRGVFTDETSFLFAVGRQIADGHRLSAAVTASSAVNGLRSYTYAEALELTGDKLYNPSWGYYGGKERNSKVSRVFQPFAMISYNGKAGDATKLTASVSYRSGKDRYSALGWFDDQNPYPDYYLYLPDYRSNMELKDHFSEKWKSGDAAVTQINWDELYSLNAHSGEDIVYFLENRTENVSDLQLALTAATAFGGGTSLSYGARYRSDNSRYYKELKSLMLSGAFKDRDQYLDGEAAINDLRNPERHVGTGDRFGYDYGITAAKSEVFVLLHHSGRRFRVTGGLELAQTALQRNGYYEKAAFPSSGSYGKSGKHKFSTYTVKLSSGYFFSPRHSAEVSAVAAALSPDAGSLFINPFYSNAAIDNPQTKKLYAADASYRATAGRLSLKISAFAARTAGESAVYRFWEDILSVYSDMTVRGIEKLCYGAELGLSFEITSRLTLSAAASAGRYTYESDPQVTTLEDATQKTLISGAKSYLKGYRTGNTPQRVASGEIRYSARGWLGSLTCNYMGDRYVDATPLRRMEYAYNMTASHESFLEFVGQEKLGDAVTLNLFLLKSFRLPHGTVTALASVDNLLDNGNIVYNAYEQMRVLTTGTDINPQAVPFPNKYLYGYGRTYYVSLTYKF